MKGPNIGLGLKAFDHDYSMRRRARIVANAKRTGRRLRGRSRCRREEKFTVTRSPHNRHEKTRAVRDAHAQAPPDIVDPTPQNVDALMTLISPRCSTSRSSLRRNGTRRIRKYAHASCGDRTEGRDDRVFTTAASTCRLTVMQDCQFVGHRAPTHQGQERLCSRAARCGHAQDQQMLGQGGARAFRGRPRSSPAQARRISRRRKRRSRSGAESRRILSVGNSSTSKTGPPTRSVREIRRRPEAVEFRRPARHAIACRSRTSRSAPPAPAGSGQTFKNTEENGTYGRRSTSQRSISKWLADRCRALASSWSKAQCRGQGRLDHAARRGEKKMQKD